MTGPNIMTAVSRRNVISTGLAVALPANAASATSRESGPNTILFNARIWRGTSQPPEAEALAITGGRIAAIGSNHLPDPLQ